MIAPNTNFDGSHAVTQDFQAALVAEADHGGSPILTRLLRMADCYLSANAHHQAMALYFQLLEQFPESTEALKARACLLEIGEHHEAMGEMHQALSIYEKLL